MWSKLQNDMASKGMRLDMSLQTAPVPLEPADLRPLLDIPPEVTKTVSWAAIISTRAAMHRSMKQMLDAAFRSQKAGILMRATMAPMLALMMPKLLDALAANRDCKAQIANGLWLPHSAAPSRSRF